MVKYHMPLTNYIKITKQVLSFQENDLYGIIRKSTDTDI